MSTQYSTRMSNYSLFLLFFTSVLSLWRTSSNSMASDLSLLLSTHSSAELHTCTCSCLKGVSLSMSRLHLARPSTLSRALSIKPNILAISVPPPHQQYVTSLCFTLSFTLFTSFPSLPISLYFTYITTSNH